MFIQEFGLPDHVSGTLGINSVLSVLCYDLQTVEELLLKVIALRFGCFADRADAFSVGKNVRIFSDRPKMRCCRWLFIQKFNTKLS